MSQDEIGNTKTETPHKHFESAHHVVHDSELSKEQKLQALHHLEQDARQLAIASSEGMSGGESTGLQEVLAAKEALGLPPLAHAYAVVLQDLRSRQKVSESDLLRNLIGQAISAFEAIQIVEGEGER